MSKAVIVAVLARGAHTCVTNVDFPFVVLLLISWLGSLALVDENMLTLETSAHSVES
jgi:hypothetical protein